MYLKALLSLLPCLLDLALLCGTIPCPVLFCPVLLSLPGFTLSCLALPYLTFPCIVLFPCPLLLFCLGLISHMFCITCLALSSSTSPLRYVSLPYFPLAPFHFLSFVASFPDPSLGHFLAPIVPSRNGRPLAVPGPGPRSGLHRLWQTH